MRNVLVIILLQLFSYQLSAQIMNLHFVDGTVIKERNYDEVEGSPYLLNEFKKGEIIDNTGAKSELLIKFDTYNNEITVSNDGSELILESKYYPEFSIEEIPLIKQRTFTSKYNIEGYNPHTYFEVIFDGNYKLLKKYDTRFHTSSVKSYGTTQEIKKFITNENYYLIKPDSSIEQITPKKLAKYFSQEKEIKQYSKEHGLSFKNDEDLIKIMTYIQSIQ